MQRLPAELEAKLGQGIIKADRPPNQTPMIMAALLVLLGLIAVPTYFLMPRIQQFELKNYHTATVTRATIIESVSGSGTIVSDLSLDVKPRTAARVKQVLVQENQLVQKNQVLLKLESDDLQAALTEAAIKLEQAYIDVQQEKIAGQATVRAAQNETSKALEQLALSQKTLQVTQRLFTLGGESKNTLEQAQKQVKRDTRAVSEAKQTEVDTVLQNKLALQSAVANLELAVITRKKSSAALQYLTVRAAISSRVARVAVQENSEVDKSTRLLTLVSLDALRIDGRIDQNNASQLQIGQPVQAVLGEQTLNAEINSIGTEASDNEVIVSIRLLEPNQSLRPGMSVGLEYSVGKKNNVLSLPRAPFLSSGGQQFVYVLDKQNATRRNVTFGSANAERIEIISGLEAGEGIISSSYETFKEFPKILVAPQGELK